MAASSIARARLVVDLNVTVAHGENKCSADPLGAGPVSSLSPAVTLLVNHAVDIVERLGVAVTPAGEVARQQWCCRACRKRDSKRFGRGPHMFARSSPGTGRGRARS